MVDIMPRYRLTTPEQVCFSYQLAGLFTRAVAYLIDAAIMVAFIFAAALVCISAPGVFGIVLILLVVFATLLGYFIFFESLWSGQTPGKRAMKIRVMDASGGQLTMATVAIRNLVRVVDVLPTLMFLGGVVAFIDPHHRRLGDMAANTIVVRYRKTGLPKSVIRREDRHNSFRADPVLRSRIIARIGREERDLIMDLTLRRDQLDAPVRERMFADLAAHCRNRLGLADSREYLSDEQTVLNIALILHDGWKGARI